MYWARGGWRSIRLAFTNFMGEELLTAEAEAQFNAVVEKYGKFLRQAIVRFCPKSLGIQFDDIEQDARVRLWRALKSEKEIPNLASYTYRIAVSATIDAIRRVKARREEQLRGPDEKVEGDPETVPLVTRPEHSPQSTVEREEIIRKVEATLRSLPENRRRVVGLYLEGLTTSDIAELLGWSEPKSRNLVYRGLKELRRQLRAQGIECEID